MSKVRKNKPVPNEKDKAIPNYGLVRVLARELQKQLDDLNDMKK